MKRSLLAGLVVLAVAIPSMAGAATAPTISIGSPTSGATFSRTFFETIPVSGLASFDAPIAAERTFYLHRDGCGSASDNPHLKTTGGTDAGDGCGTLPGPVGNPAATVFPAEDGLGFGLDASKPVTGAIEVSSFQGVVGNPVGAGVGQVTMVVTLDGRVGSSTKTLGSQSITYLVTPNQPVYTNPFTFALPAGDQGKIVSDLSLSVKFSGPAVLHNFIATGDVSFVKVPILDVGRIDVSSDSATFSAAKTVQATLNANGTWNAEVVIPSTGSRKIYARAVQGSMTTNAAPVSITVTA